MDAPQSGLLGLNRRSLAWILVLLGSAAPRLFLLSNTLAYGLSVDELQSAVYAYLPLAQLLESVRAFDPHPPLYYLQLSFWLLLGDTTDLWLKLNPLLWSVLTALSLYGVARRIYGFNVGLLASLLYSLSPDSILQSQNVRMYSLMALASVWVFFFTHRFIVEKPSYASGMGILASCLAFLYSHGAGLILLASSLTYATLLARRVDKRSVLLKWSILQGALVLLYVPWLIRARTIKVDHVLVPTAVDIAYTFSQLLFGAKIVLLGYHDLIYGASLLLMCTILFLLLYERKSRLVSLSFVVAPVIACLLISYLGRPLWLTRTLSHIVPFLCLGLAIVAIEARRSLAADGHRITVLRLGSWVLLPALIGASLWGCLYQQTHYQPWSNLLQPVRYVSSAAGPSDVVYVPNERVHWGWCWYHVGPGAVSPLDTNDDTSPEGVRVLSRRSISYPLDRKKDYWVVYRAYDRGLLDFVDRASEHTRGEKATFRDVIVEKFASRRE